MEKMLYVCVVNDTGAVRVSCSVIFVLVQEWQYRMCGG